jgi:hypothetical protein
LIEWTTVRMDAGYFLQFQRTFQRDWKAGAAAELKHVAHFAESRDLFDLRFDRQGIIAMTRYLDERLDESHFVAFGQHATRA